MRRRHAAIVLASCVVAFALLAWAAHGAPPAFDTALLRTLRVDYTGTAHALMHALLTLGDGGAIALGIGVGAWLLVRRRARDLLLYLFCVAGALALIPLLKHSFHRASLTVPNHHSFPSGHAIGSFAVSAPLLLFVRGRALAYARVLVPLYVVLVGIALVALRLHYPTDVVAGWCAAGAWISALVLLARQPDPTGG